MSGKEFSSADRIGNLGIDLLGVCCSRLGYEFREMPKKDIGIDGQMEILVDEKKVCDKYEIQVKSSQVFKNEKGKLKVRSITRNDLFYWHEDTNLPVFMVAVETSSGRCFWIDTREFYERLKLEKTQKNIMVYADPEKELNELNKQNFLLFLEEFKIFTSKRILKKGSTYEKLKILSEEKGYGQMINIDETTIPGFSPAMTFSDGIKKLSLFHTPKSILHPIVGNFEIEKRIDDSLFDINNFSLKLGNEDIVSGLKGKLQILSEKTDVIVSIITNTYEQDIAAFQEVFLDKIFIKSKENSVFNISLEITQLDRKINKTKFNLESDFHSSKSVQELEMMQNILREVRTNFKLAIKVNNQIIKLYEGGLILNDKDSEAFENFILLIRRIEVRFGVNFDVKRIIEGFQQYTRDPNLEIYIKALANGREVIAHDGSIKLSLEKKQSKPVIGRQAVKISIYGFVLFGVQLKVEITFIGYGILSNGGRKIQTKKNEMELITNVLNNIA